MTEVHPTAIVDREVVLADDVVVGPHCVLSGQMEVGAGSRLLGNVYLQGPLTLGRNNTLYPFVSLGFAPQDFKWDATRPGAGLEIGDGNVFRESVTLHRATSDTQPTRVGDRNYWMVNSHAGHDCQVGNRCVFANGTLLGGSVRVDDDVITGGNTAVHQFCRIGRGALISGSFGLNKDLPPFFMLTGGNVAGSFNVVGMRRSGMPGDQIDDVKWVYKTLYRRGLTFKQAVDEIRGRADRSIVAEYLAFFEESERGIVPGKGDPRRGTYSA
ncbi:MAG: acyl-ACP--UDP-N-acetylglucosamine O-acyltransferase [Myxococcota bacterium]